MKYLLAFLLVLASVHAAEYTLYSGESAVHTGTNFTFSLSTGLSGDLGDAVDLWEKTNSSNSTKNLGYARTEVSKAVDNAKLDDKLYVRTKAGTYTVPYKGCESFDVYKVCFKGVTYYEEDVSPLGDGQMDKVKEGPNGYLYPFTISIESAADSLSVTRTFTPSSAYVGERVDVQVDIKNTGAIPSPRFTYTEITPLPTGDDLTVNVASLAKEETKTLLYTVQPQQPGTYTFSSTGLTEKNSTLTVKDVLNSTITYTAAYTNEAVPFTLTVTNKYTSDLDITLSVAADTAFSSEPTGRGTLSANTKTYNELALKQGKSLTINGSVLPQTPGTHTITLSAKYRTDKPRTYTTTFTYPVQERSFTIQPHAGTVTLNNSLDTFVENIVVVCANTTQTLNPAHPGSAFTVPLTIPADSTCNATYTVNGVQGSQTFNQQGTILLAVPAPVTPSEPAQETTPTQETPPTQTPQQPPVVVTEGKQEDNGKNFIENFLEWLDSLFS